MTDKESCPKPCREITEVWHAIFGEKTHDGLEISEGMRAKQERMDKNLQCLVREKWIRYGMIILLPILGGLIVYIFTSHGHQEKTDKISNALVAITPAIK